MTDGSGLSRANTCTTRLQCQALHQISGDSVQFRVFVNSLPAAGRQGSMSNIGKGTFLEANLRAKTGYIQRVRAYCGYLKSRKGDSLIFSVIFNHYNCSPAEARKKIERFLLAIAEL